MDRRPFVLLDFPETLEFPDVMIDGHKNPARAAAAFLRTQGKIDESSFEVAADRCGDVSCTPGFVVADMAALDKLCQLGKFRITSVGGVFVAHSGESDTDPVSPLSRRD